MCLYRKSDYPNIIEIFMIKFSIITKLNFIYETKYFFKYC